MATNLTDLAITPMAGVQGTVTRLNDLISIGGNLSRLARPTWAFGTADDEIDQVFEDSDTPAAAATKTYILDDSSMLNPLGGAIDFDKVKAILVVNTGTTELSFLGTCPLFRAGGHAVDDLITILPGGFLLATEPGDGWAVGAGETVAIKNEDGVDAGAFDIIILGLET